MLEVEDVQPEEDWTFIESAEFRECEEYALAWTASVELIRGAGGRFVGTETFGQAEFWRGGGLVAVKTPALRGLSVVSSTAARRGIVQEFSYRARLRLLRSIAKVRKGVLPIFITLTYPGEWPANERQWKQHLEAIWKRIRRRWPRASAFWRLEFQKRGAPHFHLLLYNVTHYELALPDADGRRWLDRAWFEVVGSGDEKHLRAGVNMQPVRSFEGVMFYAAKYVGKLAAEPVSDSEGVGRFWGVLGRDTMPWAQRIVYRLLGGEAWDLRRMLARHAHLDLRGRRGLTVFADGRQWERLIREALLPFNV